MAVILRSPVPPFTTRSPGDRLKYDIVQSIRTLTLLRQEHPDKRGDGRFHFRTPAEMAAACKEHPDWLAHSLEIAERCNFEIPFGKPQFPAFAPPDGSTPREFLHQLVLDGLRRRYGERAAAMRPQIEQELSIISAVGYEEYFLVVWNILQDCRRTASNGSRAAARRTRSSAIAWAFPMSAPSASASTSAAF